MNFLVAMVIIFAFFTVGEVVAVKTKAYVSMILFCFLAFMVAFWCGMPKTLFDDSGLVAFMNITIGMFLVHVGTTIDLRDFAKEWKIVVMVLCSTIAIAIGAYFIGGLFVDRIWALAGAPILSGAMAAYLILQEQLTNALGSGADLPMTFGLLVLVFQYLVGVPVASFFLRKEGLILREEYRNGHLRLRSSEPQEKKERKMWCALPQKYNTPYFTLLKVALIAYIGTIIGDITGVSMLIFDMILGVIARALGIIEEGPLVKTGSFTFVMAATLCGIFGNIANTTPAQLVSMLLPLVGFMVVGIVCGGIVAILLGKVMNISWRMSISLAVTALFGFPATYQISHEVAVSVGENEEEVKVVESYIMPKMILAGIVSVSVVSGLIASLMATWL